MISLVIIIITALVFSAFFSGMEIAFTTSNKLKLEIERKQNRTFNYIADIFLKSPGQYITTILVGNNIALVIYSLNMSMLLNRLASSYGLQVSEGSVILETIISTIVIIFTAEFIPKATVRGNPNFYLRVFSVPLFIFYLILFPISKFATWISTVILRIFGLKIKGEHTIKSFDREDLANLIEETTDAEQEKAEHEIKIFQNALDFSDLCVRDCMVPRIDIEAIDITESIETLRQKFIETQFSRIFVYNGSIDNIIGYINTKSLFTDPVSISEILMDVDCVPESLTAQKLLTMMTKKNRAVAVVIDEFGGTAGMVSMEDILEEIFGEIEDEHDSQDLVEKVDKNGDYILSGRLEVEYLNEKYSLAIPESDEYDTLAGYIIYFHEGIPNPGQVLTMDKKKITILKVSGSKLELVRVSLL